MKHFTGRTRHRPRIDQEDTLNMTKAKLRSRWTDLGFLDQLAVPRDRMPTSLELQQLDLRGVPKLGNGDPLWHFAIRNADATGIDFSFGDGCLCVSGSTVSRSQFEEFKFDRATCFSHSRFANCDFRRARLRLDAKDCEFTDCDFDFSTFTGGMSQYGFTRCLFTNCSFRSAQWKGTYFKACTLDGCDLIQFQVIDSVVTSIKHRKCEGFPENTFSGGDIRTITETA
jgi:uncharacterized protein YjbI with pentapeptide repeats